MGYDSTDKYFVILRLVVLEAQVVDQMEMLAECSLGPWDNMTTPPGHRVRVRGALQAFNLLLRLFPSLLFSGKLGYMGGRSGYLCNVGN